MACRNHSKNIPKFSVAEKKVLENAERQIGMENDPNELTVLHEIPSEDPFAESAFTDEVLFISRFKYK